MPFPPTGTEITLGPSQVEFRLPTALGVRLVKVWLGGDMPRVSALYLRLENGEVTEHPLSLFVDETMAYVNAALTQAAIDKRLTLTVTSGERVLDQRSSLSSVLHEVTTSLKGSKDED